jgi:hypothetical protein
MSPSSLMKGSKSNKNLKNDDYEEEEKSSPTNIEASPIPSPGKVHKKQYVQHRKNNSFSNH